MKRWHLVEEEGSARGPREARGDELGAVGQRRVTVGAAEQPSAADVVQEDASHVLRTLGSRTANLREETQPFRIEPRSGETAPGASCTTQVAHDVTML